MLATCAASPGTEHPQPGVLWGVVPSPPPAPRSHPVASYVRSWCAGRVLELSKLCCGTLGTHTAGSRTLTAPLGRVCSSEEVLMKTEMLSRGGIVPRLATKAILSKSSSNTILPAEMATRRGVSHTNCSSGLHHHPSPGPDAQSNLCCRDSSREPNPRPSASPFWLSSSNSTFQEGWDHPFWQTP